MESVEISREEVRVFDFVMKSSGWFTAKQTIAATGVKSRTARRHLKRFTYLRIVERCKTFGGCHYRRIDRLTTRAFNYVHELKSAKEAFEEVKPGARAFLMRLWPWWRPVPRLRYRREPSEPFGHGQMEYSHYPEKVRAA